MQKGIEFMENKKINCWMCKEEIDCEDKYCRYCGKGQNKNAKLPYTLLGITVLLFVIGPFCLFNLWKSPLIKREAKGLYTAFIVGIMLFITIGIIYGIYFIISYYAKVLNIIYNSKYIMIIKVKILN